MKKSYCVYLILLLGLGQSISLIRVGASVGESPTKRVKQLRAVGKDRITLHAAGRGNPWINLRDGTDLPTAYTGAAGIQQVLESNLAQPLALMSADFDEDGVPDLISGYFGSGGILTLHRGNVSALWPRSPESGVRSPELGASDQPRATSDPFLPEARVFEVPEAPDFLGTGDFDADGHWDVVTAARGSKVLYLLPGDGHGNFSAAKPIQLPGAVSALTTGEINRRDGLADVVVGIVGPDGPELLVFEWPEGALRGQPETFPLPAEATALALGQLDDSYEMDLAVAAGQQLLIIHGRDRRLSRDEIRRAEVPAAIIDQRSFPIAIASLALGDFVPDQEHQAQIALLGGDGTVHVLSRTAEDRGSKIEDRQWREVSVLSDVSGSQLVRAKVSSLPTDDLVLLDPSHRQLHILTMQQRATSDQGVPGPTGLGRERPATLDVEGAPVAVLPMRLKVDTLSDLVILIEDQTTPAVAFAAPLATVTVNSTTNVADGDTSSISNLMMTPGADGVISLREAITAANNTPGLDTINFSIGTGVQTIIPTSSLPTITGAVTIDGTTQPGYAGTPIIVLNGPGPSGFIANGLLITGGSSTVKGLVINNFRLNGIQLNAGNNTITNCFIGTNAAGTSVLTNSEDGVLINGATNNTIGDTTASGRNIISGNNRFGVELLGGGATMNRVQGNYIGTNMSGSTRLPNTNAGIRIGTSAMGTMIGGTLAGAGNLISGNGNVSGHTGDGVLIEGTASAPVSGGLVQGNYIGTDAAGVAAIPNGRDGVVAIFAFEATIGGTTPEARNVISGNGSDGVSIAAVNGAIVQGNYIGTDVTGGVSLGNSAVGVATSSTTSNTAIGGTTAGAGNVISGNGGNGVNIGGSTIGANQVQSNFIGTNKNGTAAIGNLLDGVFIGSTTNNTIGGTTIQARNIISGNGKNGVELSSNSTSGNSVQGNYIGTDITGTVAMGNTFDGVLNDGSPNCTIGGMTTVSGTPPGNLISGNHRNGVQLRQNLNATQVQGNLIGTDVTGTAPLGNTSDGVILDTASNTLIGGSTTTVRNIISANGGNGVKVNNSGANQVQGNLIGTDRNGTTALGNHLDGVLIESSTNNTIGGTTAGAGNLISGNLHNGIQLHSGLSGGNSNDPVQGNLIGTDITGTIALGNTNDGVLFNHASNGTVGGTTAAARNVISANGGNGVSLSNDSTADDVQGNFIGTTSNGTSPLGNSGNGVAIEGGLAQRNDIGGTQPGAGNTIAFNSHAGVSVPSYPGISGINPPLGGWNSIRRNSIFSNSDLGITLTGTTTLTTGPPCQFYCGSCNKFFESYPVLTSAISGGGSTTIQGTLNSSPGSPFALEFFSNSASDPSGFGEGETFIGSTNVATDSTCNASFTITFPVTVPAGQFITATTSNANLDTSEFSPAILVVSANPLMITTASIPVNQVGVLSSHQFDATGGTPPYSWSLVSGTLPPGMTLSTSGLLSGTPTQEGTFTFTVRVTDNQNTTDDKQFTATVAAAPVPPRVTVTTTGSVPVPGRISQYFITVKNVGSVNATDIDVEDFIEPWFTFISADPSPTELVNFQGSSLVLAILWNIPQLAPGETQVLSYQAKLGVTFPDLSGLVPQAKASVTLTAPPPSIPIHIPFGICTRICVKIKGPNPNLEKCLRRAEEDCSFCKAAAAVGCFLSAIGTGPAAPFTYAGCITIAIVTCEAKRNFFDRPRCEEDNPGPVFEDCHDECRDAQGALDPNAMEVQPQGCIRSDQRLVYTIHFENIGTLESRDVWVIDVLDPNLDASTLEILTPNAAYDAPNRAITWSLLDINLPPGGTGEVSFAVKPLPGLASGTEIRNTAQISFESFEAMVTNEVVNTIDTTPPTMTCPAPITTVRTIPAGAVVVYAVPTASDTCDATPSVDCVPPSGSTFPLGMNTVTCTATDQLGNSANCNFTVTVIDPACTLSPTSDSNPIGTNHTVTVTVTDGSTPLGGVAVNFSVTSGPNAGASGMGTTDVNGQTNFTYTGRTGPGSLGTDTVQASGTFNGIMFSCTAMKTWFNQPPVAMCKDVTKVADNDCQAIVTPQEVNNGSFDPDGGSVTLSLSPLGPYPLGTTMVTLTVTDDEGGSVTCTAMVMVTNTAPTANAGSDQLVHPGDLVKLVGSGMDPDPGQTLSFQWKQKAGLSVTLNGANTPTATFTAPPVPEGACEILEFELKVTDSCGATATDTILVSVEGAGPLGLILQDEQNGYCLRLYPCQRKYIWRKPDGTILANSVTISLNGPVLNFVSVASDPNLLQGGISLLRRSGNARFIVPRGRGDSQVFTIVDDNIDDNRPCP